jgi:hypothetical protein
METAVVPPCKCHFDYKHQKSFPSPLSNGRWTQASEIILPRALRRTGVLVAPASSVSTTANGCRFKLRTTAALLATTRGPFLGRRRGRRLAVAAGAGLLFNVCLAAVQFGFIVSTYASALLTLAFGGPFGGDLNWCKTVIGRRMMEWVLTSRWNLVPQVLAKLTSAALRQINGSPTAV